MKTKKYVFDFNDELKTVGAIETLLLGFCEGTCTAEDLYLCTQICEGKIRYFSTFKKSAGMVYTHLLICINAVTQDNNELLTQAHAEYTKAFNKVFKIGGNK